MAVRIKDIADYLGLSSATVSMVLNNKTGFSEETRRNVLQAAETLGYVPQVGRSKPSPVGKSLPFIIFKSHGQVVTETPFFTSITESLQAEAKEQGYHLSVHYINGSEELTAEELHSIAGQFQTGLLVLATEMEKEHAKVFETLTVPYAFLDNAMLGVHANKVLMGNSQGAYDAVTALYRAGHRKIGYLKSSLYLSNFQERTAGYHSAMEELNLPQEEAWQIAVPPNVEDAYQQMREHLATLDNLPTAFFADNDLIAIGAMKALQESGYRLPEDISVIGFDDVPFCQVVEPKLSTMRVDTHNIGKAAVRLLLEQNNYFQKIEVETKLILRESIRQL